MTRAAWLFVLAALLAALPALAGGLKLDSTALREGAPIPREYTCEGEDLAPPMEWSGVPKEARELALVCFDPDAPSGSFVHVVAYDIDPGEESLARGSWGGVTFGVNDFGNRRWNGPCPPAGKPHRYVFELMALDARTGLSAGASRQDLEKAAKGHVLARARLTATYGR